MNSVLPFSAMEKLLKKAGAMRVSERAKAKLKESLEKKIKETAKKATVFSQHANRKTLKKEDLQLATED